MWLINWQSKFGFRPTDFIQDMRSSDRKIANHIPITSSQTYFKSRIKKGDGNTYIPKKVF